VSFSCSDSGTELLSEQKAHSIFARHCDWVKMADLAQMVNTVAPILASSRPTAILAGNDLSALGVLRAAREGGLHVPQDLSVGGFDDIPSVSGALLR
jgi:DNA-binding LacI/PurR family transcriptional regulator